MVLKKYQESDPYVLGVAIDWILTKLESTTINVSLAVSLIALFASIMSFGSVVLVSARILGFRFGY